MGASAVLDDLAEPIWKPTTLSLSSVPEDQCPLQASENTVHKWSKHIYKQNNHTHKTFLKDGMGTAQYYIN